MKIVVAVALVLGLATLAGCSESESNTVALERIITEQLPGEFESKELTDVKVTKVSCSEGKIGIYNCKTDVSGIDADKKKITDTLKIKGTCNDDSCRWETE